MVQIQLILVRSGVAVQSQVYEAVTFSSMISRYLAGE